MTTTTEEPLLLIAWCADCRRQAQYDGYATLCKRCHGPAELISAGELHVREQREQAKAVAAAMAEALNERGADARPAKKRPRNPDAKLLSGAAALGELGCDKTLLAEMVKTRWIETVPGPKGPRYPRSEIQRLTTPGGPGLPTRAQLDRLLDGKQPPRKMRRAKSRTGESTEGSILDIPLE